MKAGIGTEIHQWQGAWSYYTDVGKSFLGGGLELWQGLFQNTEGFFFRSACQSVGSMLINVNIFESPLLW